MKISFILNGEKINIDVDPMKRLIEVLRDDLGHTEIKEGCGEGECGACTILLNGKPVTSCILNAIHADRKEIVTSTGIAETVAGKIIIDSFDENNAVQCGFCFPGFLVTSYHYLTMNGETNSEKIKEALSGNICRCTGYKKILNSVMAACKKQNKILKEN